MAREVSPFLKNLKGSDLYNKEKREKAQAKLNQMTDVIDAENLALQGVPVTRQTRL